MNFHGTALLAGARRGKARLGVARRGKAKRLTGRKRSTFNTL